MKKIQVFLQTWGPSMLMMALIFSFSSITGSQMPNFGLVDFLVKKGGHACGYALLALANLYGLRRRRGGKGQGGQPLRLYALALLIAVMYAVTDEFHQSFVSGRHPAVTDVGIDALGACAGLALWAATFSRRQKQETEI